MILHSIPSTNFFIYSYLHRIPMFSSQLNTLKVKIVFYNSKTKPYFFNREVTRSGFLAFISAHSVVSNIFVNEFLSLKFFIEIIINKIKNHSHTGGNQSLAVVHVGQLEQQTQILRIKTNFLRIKSSYSPNSCQQIILHVKKLFEKNTFRKFSHDSSIFCHKIQSILLF